VTLARLAIVVQWAPASVGVLAGLALAGTIARAQAERARRVEPVLGTPARTTTGVIAGLAALALSLIVLPGVSARAVDMRALVVAAAFAGALWLAGRAAEDARLRPLFLLAAGGVLGAQALCGVALLPRTVGALVRRPRGLRPTMGGLLVLGTGGLLGRATCGPAPLLLPPASLAGFCDAATSWLGAAARIAGPISIALAAVGLLAALSQKDELRDLGVAGAVAIGGEIATGQLTPLGALVLALGLGLLIVELGERASVRALRGGALVLLPLVALVLCEPTARRFSSMQLSLPTLGPVPPPGPLRSSSTARSPSWR
jgi:hypothetical protein